MPFSRTRIITFCLLFFSFSGFARQPLSSFLPTDVTYNPSIPTPESFFGFQVGEWHLTPDQIHAYMKALDAVSDRISIEEFGKSYEDRIMMLMTITSADNHRTLESIREQHLRLSDPSVSPAVNIDSMPVVVWMGYSVHGNEPSGSNASVLVAYYLAAAQGADIENTLSECIVLLNPSINPDGLNRFATWANAHKGRQPVADPASREHNEVWPGGRGNHYWFDLNRDWMPVQHPETKSRLQHYYKWRPNVLTDHHEMGTNSTFFFQPGVASRENPLTPPATRKLTAAIARYHEQALNKIGSLYYSEEGYDDFYVGKGSSYPDMTGGIGILFEQASSRGHLQESSNGLLAFPFTIRNQVVTSFSTLEAARSMRKDLLSHQRTFYTTAMEEAQASPIKAYVFGLEADRARTRHLVDILRSHQIAVHALAKTIRSAGKEFLPGSAFVVPTAQPQFRLISSLFDRRTTFTDSVFYDVSTWTLPFAFALPSAELRSLDRSALGQLVTNAGMPSGSFVGATDAYAYVFDWSEYYAPRALHRLLAAEVIARVATRPFEASTKTGLQSFDYGTIMIPLTIQPEKRDTIRALIELAVRNDGITVYALQTGLTPSGIDIGSRDFADLKKPAVALIAGSGISSTDIGEAWHLLDQRMHMEVSLLDLNHLARLRLERYTSIVLAGSGIDSAGKSALMHWLKRGGTLITLEQGTEWAIANKLAPVKLRNDSAKKDSIPHPRPYAAREAFTRARSFPGSIFEVQYDDTHPLLYGYAHSPLYVLRTTSVFLEPSSNPFATPVRYAENPPAAGYMNRMHAKRIAGSAAVVVSAVQSGRVILFSDNPNFRAFWFGTNRMFFNAIFFGQVISPSSARTE